MRRSSALVIFALLTALALAACATPTHKATGGVFSSPIGLAIHWPYAYITNANFDVSGNKHGFLSVVDLRIALTRADLAAVYRIKTDAFLGKIVLSADGKTAYVTDRRINQVLLFDLTDPIRPALVDVYNGSSGTQGIPVADQPYGLTLSPDESMLYVACELSGHVSIVDLASRQMVKNTTLANGVNEVKFDPAGRFVYASNLRINSISLLDATNGNFLTSFGVSTAVVAVTGYDYRGMDFTPDGSVLYVASNRPNGLLVIDTSQLPLYPDHAVARVIPMDAAPMGVAVRPDGKEVWVTNYEGASVIAVDAQSGVSLWAGTTGHGPADIRFFEQPDLPGHYYALTVNFASHDLTLFDATTKEQIWGIP